MKLMDWNIESMNNWFVGGGQVGWRDSHHGIASVSELVQRVANVIKSVDPDVLTLQEGPSDPREMALFINDFLLDANGHPLFDAFGGLDGGAQKVYTFVKKQGAFRKILGLLMTTSLSVYSTNGWLMWMAMLTLSPTSSLEIR